MFRFSQRGAIEYLEAEAISALDIVTHAFCTRLGGISEGPFFSLNASFSVADREINVRRNLSLITDSFSIPAGRLVLMGQVHGGRVAILDGDSPPPESIPECDGLITNRPGVALGVRTADCVPLLFVDPVRRVIGVAHAGWRGTALRIASRMVDLFEQRFASRVENILIAVGPAIGVCCYQVDAPVCAAFSSMPGAERFFHPCRESGRWMLDLALANRIELTERGVPEGNIFSAGHCTACRREIFFSYRASLGNTGTQINLLMLRDEDCKKCLT
jgi:YfiH family protein